MAQKQFSYDVFLIHNSQDKPRVRKLAEQMRAAGLRVWFDDWVIKAGDGIYLAIERGLENSRTLILCMSPNTFGSDWVGLERSTVLFRDPSNADRRFIPLLLADCELPDTLRRFKYVDYRAEAEAAFTELLVVCGLETSMPIASPTTRPKNKTSLKKSTQPTQTQPIAVFERKLEGHKGWIQSVAVSPDATWLASGSGYDTIKIWDMATGLYRTTLTAHKDMVLSLAITPDGKTLFSGSKDHTIRCWQVLSGQTTAALKGHTHNVIGLAVFKYGTRLASCSANEEPPSIRLWDTATYKLLNTIKDKGNNGAIWSIAANQSGDRLVSGGGDKRVKVWDVANGTLLMTLTGHLDCVRSVQITPDGQIAISSSTDKTIKIWNLVTQSCVGTLEGHRSDINSIALSPDGKKLASAGFTDGTVRLWDWHSGVCLQIIKHDGLFTPTSVTFSPDDTRLVISTYEGIIYIYRINQNLSSPSSSTPSRYKNAKVVLIGEKTIGKTSLAHRLIEDKYVIKDRTHGMIVWRLDLPDNPHFSPNARSLNEAEANDGQLGATGFGFAQPAGYDVSEEREALLWDLAGQEDYRLIHQLFLPETALALLLINPQKDDPFAEAGDWLKAINTAGKLTNSQRAVAKLLIFSQIDAAGMKLGNTKIDRFINQHGFAAWLATSAKTGENCSDSGNDGQASTLKQLIAEHIPWETLPWTSTPRLLTTLKNAVVAMRDDTDIRLLRFAELAQRLESMLPEEAFGAADIRTAVTLLANHGLVRPLKFGDLVLLRPDLLNGYAAAIIRAARAHTDEIGCVAEADIYHADFDFTGVERLNRADEELLLRDLVQTLLEHALCIAEDTGDGRHLVFPSQYRREYEIPKHPDIFVSYTFCGEWQSIYTTLVVRLWYSREFGHKELWRNAAEFKTSKNHILGLKIDNKQGEGEATISLFFDVAVPDELKVNFIGYIHRHLAKYASDVRRDRRYICACGKAVTDLEAVRKRFEMKKDFIFCQDCDEKVELIDFIEQRLVSDPVAQKVLNMDATATRELDSQALEQILIGHMMAITGEASQIFRPVTMFDYGIDGEVEFKDNDGKASGKKIYIQLKSGNSYLRVRKTDDVEIFDVKNERHLAYWQNQPVDVYLVIRQQDERTGEAVIRWMNVTRYLKEREDKDSKQIVFNGSKLDMSEIWRVRNGFF